MPKRLLPTSLLFDCRVQGSGFAPVASRIPELLKSLNAGRVIEWQVASLGSSKDPAKLDSAFAGLKDADYDGDNAFSIEFEDGVSLGGSRKSKRKGGTFKLAMYLPVTAKEPIAQRSESAWEAASYLAEHFPVLECSVRRVGGSDFLICPFPPLAQTAWQILFVNQRGVAESYDEPSRFWDAGWERREDFASGSLLGRGLKLADDVEYLEQVVPMQWDLIRAARAGLTEYFQPVLAEEEEPVYRKGESVLHPVGHAAGENLVEFSCYLGDGQHMPGWEIMNLWNLREEGKLPDGRKVDTVRVVFYTREMAMSERRPLLDIGVRVFYQDGLRNIAEITE
jgi:hypothetical protein